MSDMNGMSGMSGTPLAILDLVPISAGSNAAQALRNSVDLARRAEEFGYARYWFAEHHLNPGVAGTSPAVVIALVAGATGRIRLGAGAVQLGHRTALSTVEEFGLLDALYPGHIDLGLGRSPSRGRPGPGGGSSQPSNSPERSNSPEPSNSPKSSKPSKSSNSPDAPNSPDLPKPPERGAYTTENGLLIPPAFDYRKVLGSPRFALAKALLQQPNAESQDYAEQVEDILALLRGTYTSAEGVEAHIVPGEGADLELWILGSSGGESARVAGGNGLRFAANYHVSPATVLEAVDGYRQQFKPSQHPDGLSRPYVSVSADVVVAEDEAKARELASGYGQWVRSIRTAEGAIEFPAPREAASYQWTDEARALVEDRVRTQFVGTAKSVADQLEILRDATGADELIVTTITHEHADRVRSFELLAEEWATR